jgi:hypothetical protein
MPRELVRDASDQAGTTDHLWTAEAMPDSRESGRSFKLVRQSSGTGRARMDDQVSGPKSEASRMSDPHHFGMLLMAPIEQDSVVRAGRVG